MRKVREDEGKRNDAREEAAKRNEGGRRKEEGILINITPNPQI